MPPTQAVLRSVVSMFSLPCQHSQTTWPDRTVAPTATLGLIQESIPISGARDRATDDGLRRLHVVALGGTAGWRPKSCGGPLNWAREGRRSGVGSTGSPV